MIFFHSPSSETKILPLLVMASFADQDLLPHSPKWPNSSLSTIPPPIGQIPHSLSNTSTAAATFNQPLLHRSLHQLQHPFRFLQNLSVGILQRQLRPQFYRSPLRIAHPNQRSSLSLSLTETFITVIFEKSSICSACFETALISGGFGRGENGRKLGFKMVKVREG